MVGIISCSEIRTLDYFVRNKNYSKIIQTVYPNTKILRLIRHKNVHLTKITVGKIS